MRRALAPLCLLLLAACHRAPHPTAALDPGQLYPLVVRAHDVPPGGGLVKPLGLDGLEVALVTAVAGKPDQPTLVLGVTDADLATAHLSEAQGWSVALQNLTRALQRQVIPARLLNNPETQQRMAVFQGDWRAASCLLVPHLREVAAGQLGTSSVLALIPRRDVLVLLPDRGPAANAKLEQFVLQKVSGGTSPALTDRPLRLLARGAQPFFEAPPAAYADR